MHRSNWPWWGIVALAGVSASVVVRSQREGAMLQRKVAAVQQQQHEDTERLRGEVRSLARLTAEKEEATRANEMALARLRSEVATLQQRAQEEARRPAAKPAVAPRPANPVPASRESSVTEEVVPMTALRRRGLASPVATLETALWAAVGGDIETLADTVTFEPEVRARAEAVLAQLPNEERGRYPTAEHFVAAMTIKDVPLGSARIFPSHPEVPHMVGAQLFDERGMSRVVALTFLDTAGGWRLRVPMSAVEKYERMLTGETAGPVAR